MTKAKEESLRRVAIVLASLPESVSQKLIGSLQRDTQRSIRAALGNLADVDPLEQRRALDGFASSLKKDKSPASNHAAEVVFSRAALKNLNQPSEGLREDARAGTSAASQNDESPLSFLLDVDDETLVSHLKQEMPQTLAIILASISPSQAARVLPRLEPSVRAEAMRRLASLSEIPGDVIETIGGQLRERFSAYSRKGTTGRRALDAILAEMPDQGQSGIAKPMAAPETRGRASSPESSDVHVMNSALGHSAASSQSVNQGLRPSDGRSAEARSAEGRASEPRRNQILRDADGPPSPALRVAEGTWRDDSTDTERTAKSRQSTPVGSIQETSARRASATLRSVSPLDSTDSIHAYLCSLAPDQLRDALGRAQTRQALLTLCGLPNQTAEAVLASLPRKQAKQVREQLTALGTLQLREIDQAKAAIAEIAYSHNQSSKSLAANGKATTTEANPRLSAAAA